MLETPETVRVALCLTGDQDDPPALPWSVENMALVACVAGKFFTMITGGGLACDDLDADKPERFGSGPTESHGKGDIELDRGADLPWPNPEKARGWSEKQTIEFRSGVRRFLGRPIDDDWLREVLEAGQRPQRAVAGVERATCHPGTPLFEVRALGFRQLAVLQ